MATLTTSLKSEVRTNDSKAGFNSSSASAKDADRILLEIEDYDQIPPFFCSLTSDANIWLFVSSTGSLTAGREDADHAMLPYETVDRIHDSAAHTGPFALFRWKEDGAWKYWQPFKPDAGPEVKRRLLKNILGSRLTFEESNLVAGLVFRSTLMISDRFGLVRQCELMTESKGRRSLEVIHGVRNLVPTGVTQRLQNELSCLTDAYKQNELLEPLGLAVYSMSSGLTDQPEPHESLRATVAWSRGLCAPVRSLDAKAVNRFCEGEAIAESRVTRGVRGHFVEFAALELNSDKPVSWIWVGDTALDQASVARLGKTLQSDSVVDLVYDDIVRGESNLRRRLAAADGLQLSEDSTATAHHLANVLFNLMRGGIFADGYELLRDDFVAFLKTSNKRLVAEHEEWLSSLPLVLNRQELQKRIEGRQCPQLERIFLEYLPLSFSRRHGDPSRPWNRFKIQTRDANGNEILAFQGNWRDIFQNWEALALSFPDYLEHMVSKFVNASTPDGYNPYRITREGIDWEEPDPEDPWAAYGYWGDHQIIYLLKLLECMDAHEPGKLGKLLHRQGYSYANVPYRIHDYDTILKDPRNTMSCDMQLSALLHERAAAEGSDGKLLWGSNEMPALVCLLEKLLVPILAKWSNFVPGGGIWMTTQRPEWNDANNALVGNGLSMVTLYYLRRHQQFLTRFFSPESTEEYTVSKPVVELLEAIDEALCRGDSKRDATDAEGRRRIVDALGKAGSDYRALAYREDFSSSQTVVSASRIHQFLQRLTEWADDTIRINRREDGLYHAYNLMLLTDNRADIRYLEPMLEGQVAVLSAGMLDAAESVKLLESLRVSSLYCSKRKTYLLYPDRDITPFLRKNQLAAEMGLRSNLLKGMIEQGDTRLVVKESDSVWRFHPDLYNEGQLRSRLDSILADKDPQLQGERQMILDIYEVVFNHHSFTGRSGSMFAYEGLGSVYWHMVSKLLLAVQENLYAAVQSNAETALREKLDQHYQWVRDGLGYRKSAQEYGAFPTDPYSHTPAHAGAQQPGMTGQVKEEILTRRGELGVWVLDGCLNFAPIHSFIRSELLSSDQTFSYLNKAGRECSLTAGKGSFAYTVCQTPVVCKLGADAPAIKVHFNDRDPVTISGCKLSRELSRSVFARDQSLGYIEVSMRENILKQPQ
ncbi:MAG: hypothetical protein JJU20_04705 [Opitutales bacterium]|nr:hypothetical protein [Opitutales bacterium]